MLATSIILIHLSFYSATCVQVYEMLEWEQTQLREDACACQPVDYSVVDWLRARKDDHALVSQAE